MIRIHVFYKNCIIDSVLLEGHALYDDYGKDIVCASVSSTYLCTVNAIYAINENSVSVIDEENRQIIQVKSTDKIIQILLQNMIRCFKSLERQYPKNIKLDKEEK